MVRCDDLGDRLCHRVQDRGHIRALEKHTAPMVEDLKRGDLEAARKKASMVVSRDVSKLDQEHVTSCAVETVAGNLVDSVLSPMFYFGLAGVSGAISKGL